MTWGPEQRRASWVSALAVGIATLLVLLVAVWAASAGPDDPFRGEGLNPDRVTTSDPPPPTETVESGAPAPAGDRDSPSSTLTRVIVILLGVLAVALVVTAVSMLVTLRPHLPRWRRRSRGDALPAVELDPVDAVAAAISEDAVDQAALLRSGTPRNGVVACWHRFEVQAAQAGVAREPWETSSEFTLRLLDLVEADAAAVARLAGIYREARFSEHELGEDARTDAQDALQRIHHDLRTLLSGGRR